MTQTMVHRGPLDLGDGVPARQLDVWKDGGAFVAFDGGTTVAVLTGGAMAFTEDDRLQISGTSDGEPATWTGAEPARNRGQWSGMRVRFPEGVQTGATVTWTQYGVIVGIVGSANRVFPGARTEVSGSQRWILDGDGNRILVESTTKSCGSCGR